MADIHHREQKIQEKRKNTPWRDFVKEIGSWKNIGFYKNKGLLSRYPVSERKKEIVSKESFSLIWDDLLQYGIVYDESKNFFSQVGDILCNTPLPSVVQIQKSENSDYTDISAGAKNAYLSFTVFNTCENVLYSESIKDYCRNVLNSVTVRDNAENVYQSYAVFNSQNIFYARYITDSFNIRFSSNLRNCKNCIFCDGLDNVSYYIKNKAYTKEEFTTEVRKILGNPSTFDQHTFSINKKSVNYGSKNISGTSIINSSDVENGQYVYRLHGGRNIFSSGSKEGNKNFFDCIDVGSPHGSDFYGIMGAGASENIFCSVSVNTSSNIYYSYFINDCSYCLGCVGLKNKSFCILNKQYTKEERFAKANEIFQKMDADGELGQFFPGRMNPFYFNDTAAYLIDPSFTKEEVEKEGYLRRDEPIKVDIPEGVQTVETKDLLSFEGFDSEGNRRINDEILRKVIVDEGGNTYRIIPMELEFLQKHGLPLPRLHWLDRIKMGFR